MNERRIERALAQAARNAGGHAYKFVSPSTNGMPDRLLILPGGHIGFVELKAPGQKPRPIQTRRHEQLRALGCAVFVVDHPDQIPGVIDAIRTA